MSLEALEAEYRKAVERERFVRNATFTGVTESIGRFEVEPMTLRHYVALQIIRSPFLFGGIPTPEDASAALWLLSPDYDPNNWTLRKQFLKRFNRRFGPPRQPLIHFGWAMDRWSKRCPIWLEKFSELIAGIRNFIDESLQDRPPTSEGASGPSYYSEAASICHMFGSAYGWTNEETMQTPLKILFQQMKLIRAEKRAEGGRQLIMFNPSDRITNKILEELNRN